MAMGRGSALLHLALLNFLTLSIFSRLSSATQYTVGGSTQKWNLNVDYTTWAAQYSFKTGDTLLFSYNAEEHSVLQVSQADYGSCTISSPIKSYDDGNTVVALAQATTYYFVCGVPGHCGQGMQVAIKVGAGTSTPPTSTPSTPPPASTPPPTTSTPPISTPPPASAPPISTPSAPPSIASSPTPSTTSPTPSPSPSPSISPSPTTPSSSPTSSPSSSNPSSLSPSTPPSTTPNSSPSPKAILSFTILLGALRFILL